jgi:hypothetical protein
MEFLEEQLVVGFKDDAVRHLAEAVEFAVQYRINRGETDRDELRQSAQDSLMQILPSLLDATREAYRRSPLDEVDHGAIAVLFKRLAIRAKLMELDEAGSYGVSVTVRTRKGHVTGSIIGLGEHEGQYSVHLLVSGDDVYLPVDSIQDLEV